MSIVGRAGKFPVFFLKIEEESLKNQASISKMEGQKLDAFKYCHLKSGVQ